MAETKPWMAKYLVLHIVSSEQISIVNRTRLVRLVTKSDCFPSAYLVNLVQLALERLVRSAGPLVHLMDHEVITEGLKRRPWGWMGANQILLLKTWTWAPNLSGDEEVAQTKSTSTNQWSHVLKMFLELTWDQENESITNQKPKKSKSA
jgi:hypothetical protein